MSRLMSATIPAAVVTLLLTGCGGTTTDQTGDADAEPTFRPTGTAAAIAAAAAPSAPTTVSSGASTANASSYPLGTVSFHPGSVYLAFLLMSDGGGATDPTPGVVGPGTTWAKVDAGEASTGAFGLTAYSFVPTTDAIGVSLSTGSLSTTHEGIWYSVVEISGDVDLDDPIAQYVGDRRGTGTGYSLSLPKAPASNSLVVASFAHGEAEGSAPAAGWAEVPGTDGTHAAPPRGAHVIFDDSNPTNPAGSTWASTKSRRGLVVEVPSGNPTTPPTGAVIVAAGDLCGSCATTSQRVADVDPDAVITLGDLAYTNGLASEYFGKYGGGTTPQTRWGRPTIKDITLPGYGNHDCYDVPRATGATKQGCDDAVAYFGPDSAFGTDIPGTPGSYYATVGDWLIVQLNSAGNVGSGQATPAELNQQTVALEQILADDTHTCELVAWHHPRYSSGSEHGSSTFVDPWFEAAYDGGVDVVLNGHDHDYERFAPQNGNAAAVPDGVLQIVVGSGGASTHPFDPPVANSVARIVDKGVLRMDLGDDETYSFQFLDDITGAVDDSGTRSCHD